MLHATFIIAKSVLHFLSKTADLITIWQKQISEAQASGHTVGVLGSRELQRGAVTLQRGRGVQGVTRCCGMLSQSTCVLLQFGFTNWGSKACLVTFPSPQNSRSRSALSMSSMGVEAAIVWRASVMACTMA